MKWNAYQTKVPGKWVLAGEHTVLKGGVAIAFPHPEFSLEFSYTPGGEKLVVTPDMASQPVQDLIRVAQATFSEEFRFPSGQIEIKSSIPFGAGLGSSAALSVALSRWLLTEKYGSYDNTQVIELARTMENRFHGKSSGMDVSVVAIEKPIRFSMREGARILDLPKLPVFRFTDTGLRASTKDCVEQVEKFRAESKDGAREQDLTMQEAAQEVLNGFSVFPSDTKAGLDLIASGMSKSRKVFDDWGLNPKAAQEIMHRLQGEGALTSRLTGAGRGGFIVSLWSE